MEQLRDVSNILWRERNLLELLAFKLDSERLLARAGRTRWLARADHEVERVVAALKSVELERGVHVQSLVEELGIEADPTLMALSENVPAEWSGILIDHRRALLELARDVDRSARRSRRQPSPLNASEVSSDDDRGASAVSRALADIVMPTAARNGTEPRAATRHSTNGKRTAVGRPDAVVARLPSLVDFLR